MTSLARMGLWFALLGGVALAFLCGLFAFVLASLEYATFTLGWFGYVLLIGLLGCVPFALALRDNILWINGRQPNLLALGGVVAVSGAVCLLARMNAVDGMLTVWTDAYAGGYAAYAMSVLHARFGEREANHVLS